MTLAALLVNAALLAGCSGWQDDGHPSDQQIIADFERRRAEFESLAAEAAAGPGAISTPQFQARARSLGVELVQTSGWPASPEVRFALSSRSRVTEGSSKGLIYTRSDPGPQLESLDGAAVSHDTEGFRRIEDNWHVFLSR